MNIYKKHRKLILYSSILLISILLIYFSIVFSKMISQKNTPLLILLLSIAYAYIISFIFRKLELNPPIDFIHFLSSHNLKIKFYKTIAKILKIWNWIVLVLIIIMVLSVILIFFTYIVWYILLITNTINNNSTNIPELLSNNSVLKYMLIVIVFSFISFLLIAYSGFAFFALVFPLNKSSGRFDTSDIPISLIARATEDIHSFSFSLTREIMQQNKNDISNLVNDALEFITVEDKFYAIPIGMRYSQQFLSGLKNKAAKRDILYRINGLSEELEKIIIKLNCMNTIKDKEEIYNEMKKYGKIIEDGNLCEIKKVEYKYNNAIWKTTEKIALSPLYYLMRIIFRF